MTALDLPPESLKKYRPLEAIRIRKANQALELTKRRRLASLTARRTAKLLRSEFGAQEVFLFGSLARQTDFTLFSDIDLAARGIPSDRFFEAVGVVIALSTEFNIDLVELETCPPTLLKEIEESGKML